MPASYQTDERTSRPTTNARGLVTGYGRSYDTGPDYPVYNPATGQVESIKTGKKWTGVMPGLNNATSAASSASATQTGQPAAPVFTTSRTEKQPAINTAINALLEHQQTNSDAVNKSFQDYLAEAREVNAQSKVQLGRDQAAFDTTKIEAELPAINRNYQAGQEAVTGSIEASNRDYATQTKATLDKLTAENAAYERAAQAVAAQGVAAAQARNNLYQLGTGTPSSASGNMSNRAMRAYTDINIPLQRELADRRYMQTANIERPLDRELYGNDQAVFARQSSLESDYAAKQADTARYLQSLKMQVAGMSRAAAQDYLRNLGLPFEVAARILAGDIANVGGIQALDERANYYTLNTPFDPSRLPPVNTFLPQAANRTYTGSPVGIPSGAPAINPVAAASSAAGLPPAGTLAGDMARGLPSWAIEERKRNGFYSTGFSPLSTTFGSRPSSGGGYVDGSLLGSYANPTPGYTGQEWMPTDY